MQARVKWHSSLPLYHSTWTHEANHIPSVSIGGTPIPYNPAPKLLGVHFDRTLSFEPHAKEVARAASGKLGIIASVGNSKWGWDKEHLRQLYFSFMRSKMDYSGPGWQPWLSDHSINLLERMQNKALLVVTG